MRGKLLFVALSGFAVSAVCLGGAFALNGNAVGGAMFDFGGLPACGPAGSTATSRTLAWDGGEDRVAVAVAANSYYRPGNGDQLVIKGDPRIISHVYVRDGVVGIDCNPGGFFFGRSERIELTLPGRKFRTFELRGSGDMRLAELAQPEAQILIKGSGDVQSDGKIDRLAVEIHGSGDMTASGTTDALNVDIRGSGNAKLGGLTVKSADVRVDGSGDVEIAPRDAASVSIVSNGSGDIDAAGSSDSLKLAMHGSGDARLGGLAVKNAEVRIAGSGDAEVAPSQSLNAGIAGSGDVQLRTEPAKLDASISGSGEIIHPDGTRQDRHHFSQRHARLEDREFKAAMRDETARGHDGSDEDLERAQAGLEARIKARVARELDRAGVGPDTD